MIYEFCFKNYRSYKNEAGIDFTAKPISEFENSLIYADNNTKVLPVCAIYGPNGGGKSNALKALRALQEIVIGSLLPIAFMRNKNERMADASVEELLGSIDRTKKEAFYYKWDDESVHNPTWFSVLFKSRGRKYRYEIQVKDGDIEEENLYFENLEDEEADVVFERDREGIYLCDELQSVDIDRLNEGIPLLSYIFMFKNIDLIDDAVRFFMGIKVLNFDSPKRDRQIMIQEIENDKDRILNVVRSMGIDICDVRVEHDVDGKVKEIYMKHALENQSSKELEFSEESSGTRKIFSVLPVILNGIDKGRLFVVDELDAKLHPLLLRRLIELFTDPETNRYGSQMLITSHDMTTMSSEVFRRDEIWFSALNGYNESVLYSLVDFKKENGHKPRNDENYNKQYLEGRYGADPYMRRLKNWKVVSCP